jgi:hypothetical protein
VVSHVSETLIFESQKQTGENSGFGIWITLDPLSQAQETILASKPEDETALYDDPEFFAAYDEMRALEGTLNDIVETPALISLMPKLQGITAADLGCGIFMLSCLKIIAFQSAGSRARNPN